MDWLLGGCCGEGGRVVWTTAPELLWTGLALVGLGLGLTVFRPRGRAWTGPRIAESLCLLLGSSILGLMLAGPIWLQEGERREEGRFITLIDVSRSMSVVGGDGQARSAAVANLLKKLPAGDVYTFGESLKAAQPITFDESDTDLGGALSALSQRYAGERLAGVALISDGLDRSGLRRRLLAEQDPLMPHIGGPLTVYAVGEAGAQADIAVDSMTSGGFAFLNAPFHIDVNLGAQGFAGRTVTVSLTRDGQPVGSRPATLDAAGKATIRFEVTEHKEGRYIYEASIPVLPGDAIPSNNSAALAVRLVRDRVRVLQVCGAPSWDQKFLRLFLKEDPGIDLVSFFILRTNADMGSGYRPDELSLIQFPYESLFAEELSTFDLVIFQNFDYAPYFDRNAETLLGNIREYVLKGGALVMLGGDRSFDLGKYAGTPVAEVLPINLGVKGDAVDITPFQPALTAAGGRHPITQLAPDPSENAAWWGRLASFYGLNLSLGARPGAAVLLEHPTLKDSEGKPLPILTVGTYGQGRSMALMGDSSWRWFLGEAGEGRGNQAYLRFWKNAMRWLIADPGDRPVQVDLARENYQQGEEIRVMVRVRDISFAAVPDAKVSVELEGPEPSNSRHAETGPDGLAVIPIKAGRRGAWRIKATATAPDGTVLGEARSAFAVTNRDPELDEITPDADFLRNLAIRMGGKFVSSTQFEDPLIDTSAGRTVRDRKETPLYAIPLLPLLLGLSFGGGWWLRRKDGQR